MKKTSLAGTNTQVSLLALGCMYFGTRIDEKTAFEVLDRYVEAGGNFLDTANNYAFWQPGAIGDESEKLLGRWMRSRQNRDHLVIATKVGARPTHVGGDLRHAEGLEPHVFETALQASLKRLGTDHIDVYYTHIDDRQPPMADILGTLNELIQHGAIKHIGCSNITPWRIEEAYQLCQQRGWQPYCCAQQRYSYLRPKLGADFGLQSVMGERFGIEYTANPELLDYARQRPLTITAYSPLLSGAYSRSTWPEAYVSQDTVARMTALDDVAAATGGTRNQIVLAWMMQQSPSVLPVLAVSSLAQMEENLVALELKLTPEQMERLTRAHA